MIEVQLPASVVYCAVGLLLTMSYWSMRRRVIESRRRAALPNLVAVPEGAQLIPRDGSETFFQAPLRDENPNPVYRVEVSGMVWYRKREKPYTEVERMDAIYRSKNGRFVDECRLLLINNKHLRICDIEWIEEDRACHRYTFTVGGLKERLGLAFDGSIWNRHYVAEGALFARVTLLPPGSMTRRQRERAESIARYEARKVKDRQAQEAEKIEMETRRAEIAARHFQSQINALRVEAQLYENWSDPQFQKAWAKVHTKEVLSEAADIRTKARLLLSQTPLVQELQRASPEALATHLGKLSTLTSAERYSVRRPMVPSAEPRLAPPPESKRELDQARLFNKVRQQRQLRGEKLALAKDRVAATEEVKDFVSAQYGHRDEDERERIVSQILEEIDEEGNNGQVL